MSADNLSDKELSALLKLAAAALDDPSSVTPDQRRELIGDLDLVAMALDERRGVLNDAPPVTAQDHQDVYGP